MQRKYEDAYTYLDISLLTNIVEQIYTANPGHTCARYDTELATRPEVIDILLSGVSQCVGPDIRDFLAGHSRWEQRVGCFHAHVGYQRAIQVMFGERAGEVRCSMLVRTVRLEGVC